MSSQIANSSCPIYISCSLLVNTSHTDESLEGWNTCMWIYPLNLVIEHSGEHRWEQNIFRSFTTPQAFWQSSAPGALSTLVTSVVLYSLTRATLMSPGKDETRVCGYIRSEFIHWALWRTLTRTECFLFVRHTTSILARLSTWCFEQLGDINFSLRISSSHTHESWEGGNTCLCIYALNLFIEHSGEHGWEENISCSFTTPQAFWQHLVLWALWWHQLLFTR